MTAAAEAAARQPRLPELDRTDLELFTIDPPGSKDLDQALHVAAAGSGFVVSYAIADVAAFVSAGDPVDVEARRRGLTLYAPDVRTPLHPPVLSEGAASLLPDQVRPALLWTLGSTHGVSCSRRRPVPRAGPQPGPADVRAGPERDRRRQPPGGPPALLVEVGRRREELERERGGVSLQIPAQEIEVDAAGRYTLTYRATLAVEGYNAQISLLTGMAAAGLMLARQIGVVRTLPAADPGALRRLRRTAAGPADPLAEDAGLPRVRPQSRPEHPGPCGDAERLHRAVPRCRLHRLRR